MNARIETAIQIARPVEDVFAYVLDVETNGPAWAPDLESVEKTSEGPIGAGTTFRQIQNVMGKRRETSLRFTGVETNREIAAEADLGPLAPTLVLAFEPVGDGETRVTAKGQGNPKGPLKLLSPFVAKQGRRMWEARLAGLKRCLEAQESAAPDGPAQ